MNEIFKEKPNPPFKNLQDSGINEVLRVPEANQSLLIKELDLEDEVSSTIDETNRNRLLFRDFSKKYGINAPDVSYVIGPSSQKIDGESLYQIKEKVHGIEFKEFTNWDSVDGTGIKMEKEEFAHFEKEVENTLLSLAKYLTDLNHYHNGKPYLYDIFSARQWVYGKKEEDEINKMYLIDVDDFKKYEGIFQHTSFYNFAAMIHSFEIFLKKKLFNVRTEMLKAVSSIPKESVYREGILKDVNERLQLNI